MQRTRDSLISASSLLGQIKGGVRRGQAYVTLTPRKATRPYDTATASAVYSAATPPSFEPQANWDRFIVDYFNASMTELSEYVVKIETSGPSSLATYNGLLDEERKSLSDVTTPNYKKRSAAGEVINNPCLSVHTKCVGGVASSSSVPKPTITITVAVGTAGKITGRDLDYRNAQGNMIRYAMWRMLIYWKVDYSTDSTVVTPRTVLDYFNDRKINWIGSQNALNTAYGNINAAALELPSMLAEGKSTISHLAQTAIRLAQLISNIKRGNFSSLSPKTYKKWKSGGFGSSALQNSPEVVSNAWLEARYAWTPLVLDAVAAASLLSGSSRNQRMTFRGKDSDSSSEEVSYAWTEAGLKFSLTGILTIDQVVRVGHLCESRFDSPLVADLGLTNILGAIKEVIPWSFVVEWFVNLSGFIYRLNPSPAYIILTSWVTLKADMHFQGDVEVTAPDGSKQTVPFVYRRIVKDRKPIDNPANITLNTRLNVTRLIDSLAFLRQIGR